MPIAELGSSSWFKSLKCTWGERVEQILIYSIFMSPVPFKSLLSCVVYLKFVRVINFFVILKSIKMSKIHAISQEILWFNITPAGSAKKMTPWSLTPFT